MVSIPQKRCSKGDNCVHPNGCWLPATLTYFSPDLKNKNGLKSVCKVCRNNLQKQRTREKNPSILIKDEISNMGCIRCASIDECKNPQGAILPATKKYFYPNKYSKNGLDYYCKECRKHHRHNPDTIMRDQEYQKRNNEKGKIRTHLHRARKRNFPSNYTVADWNRALGYFHNCCAICERQLTNLLGTHKPAADHWIPLSSPDCPGTIPTNIIPLCHGLNGCNNRKSNRKASDFLEETFGKRKAKKILARIEAYFEWVRAQSRF